jgi:two-component system, OmpR family, phosphate regulon sensor histidine kinase PhoR
MMLGSLRVRLFVVTLALVGAFAATSGLWLAGRMRAVLTQGVEEDLHAHAMTLFHLVPDDASERELVLVAKQVGLATETRVTIVAADGRVLADSELYAADMDEHSGRPEVIDALGPAGGGMARRYSDSLATDMIYVAVPWTWRGEVGVVRVARPLTDVEAEVSRLQLPMWIGGLGGLLLVVVLSGAFGQLVTRDLRALTLRARALASPDGDPGGNEIAWITGSIDRLTVELKRAVDEVADERSRLHAVIAGMREGVIAFDRDGKIHTTNPSARALLGPQGALDYPVLKDLVDRALDSELPGAAELKRPGVDGAPASQLVVTTTPQKGGGAVVVLHDVTEIRRLEAVRRDFVANVSHELRTPVTAIISNAEALVDGAVGDPVHGPRFAEAVSRSAERLGALVSDLLDLAQIEGGGQLLDIRPVAVAPAVSEALEVLQHKADHRGQRVTISVSEDLMAMADAVALQQVLVNLIDNAIKYTPDGGNVSIEAESTLGSVQIDVADDGQGVAAVHRARVFERFYRVDPGRSRGMGGTGLGLAIVKHLVEIQGGTVQLLANQPQGARFRVLLGWPENPVDRIGV